MFMTLMNMYDINNTSRTLAFKQRLHQIIMTNRESIMSYFIKISELRDWLSTIGHIVGSKKLSMLSLNGPLDSLEFVRGIGARSKFLKFDQLKIDCLQEESRLITGGLTKTIVMRIQMY